jgi:hypothetical protein
MNHTGNPHPLEPELVRRIPAIVATRGLTLVNRSRGQRRAVRASSATEESVSAAQF